MFMHFCSECVSAQMFPTLCDIMDPCQAPLFIGFSREEYWSGLSFPPLGTLPNPGIKLMFPSLKSRFFITEPPEKPTFYFILKKISYTCIPNRVICIGLSYNNYFAWLLLYQIKYRSITINKASGGDGISVNLLQILKDDAVKVLHSICQRIWKTQQWPQDWKRSVFIPIPKKGNPKKVQITTQLHSSHALAKECSKFSKPGFSSTWTENFQMFKLDWEKAEEQEIK